jgi:hypothetical protein
MPPRSPNDTRRIALARRALAVGGLLLLGACAHPTEAKYRALLDPWIGEPIDNLVEAWGYPTSSFVAPNGRPVYLYAYSQSYLTPTYTTSFGGVSRSIFGGYDTSTTSVSTGGQIVTHYCKTFFEVGGARRKIVKITFEGDSCRSF